MKIRKKDYPKPGSKILFDANRNGISGPHWHKGEFVAVKINKRFPMTSRVFWLATTSDGKWMCCWDTVNTAPPSAFKTRNKNEQ